jgi:sec-independent protein translocase protein TatB
MLDVGWQELFVIGIVAVVVIGPKDLPQAIRTFTRAIRKVRSMAGEFQRGLEEVVREAEVEEIRKEIAKTADLDIAREIENTIDPTGNLARELDMSDLQADLDATAKQSAALPPAPADTREPPASGEGPAEPQEKQEKPA